MDAVNNGMFLQFCFFSGQSGIVSNCSWTFLHSILEEGYGVLVGGDSARTVGRVASDFGTLPARRPWLFCRLRCVVIGLRQRGSRAWEDGRESVCARAGATGTSLAGCVVGSASAAG